MCELSFLSKIRVSTEFRNAQKKEKVSFEKLRAISEKQLKRDIIFEQSFRSTSGPKIIAEIKKKSPSQGTLAERIDPSLLAKDYIDAGASAISVLTEPSSFGGSIEDIIKVRSSNPLIPILQKDFIIDPYQIYEASIIGATAILLIVALIGEDKLKSFSELATSLGLSVLVEVHTLEELEIALKINSKIVGINNRDLHSLTISLDISRKLIELIPEDVVAISESGISSVEEIRELYSLGFDAFLIGSSFMRTPAPAKELNSFMQKLVL